MALLNPLNMTEMWGLEGSLRPNTMHFAQGSDRSNRAHIVFVRAESPDYTTLLFTALRIQKPGKEEGKQAFLECHTKNKQRVKPSVDK